MAKLDPKPKQKGKIDIPEPLRDGLREVHDLIWSARLDPDFSLDFDDAIQCEHLCGGRNPKDRKRFDLTYYPPDAPRCRWSLTLHKLEIEDIADGVMKAVTLWSCTDPRCRCKFRSGDEHCSHCDWADDGPLGGDRS